MQTDRRNKKKALTRKGCPTFQRRRQDMRTAFCERQQKHNELCLLLVWRQQGGPRRELRAGLQESLAGASRSGMLEKAAWNTFTTTLRNTP